MLAACICCAGALTKQLIYMLKSSCMLYNYTSCLQGQHLVQITSTSRALLLAFMLMGLVLCLSQVGLLSLQLQWQMLPVAFDQPGSLGCNQGFAYTTL